MNPRYLALAALAGMLGCQRCSSPSGDLDGGSARSPADLDAASTSSPSAGATAASANGAPVAADVPEVRDTGRGRATAALRAVLQAYGIAFDAEKIERECQVDEDGASLDDLEDVAVKYGLEAGSVIVPVEHVLLPAAKMLPAIVIADAPEDEEDFVVAWRLEGDRVEIMDPREGRRWVARSELQKSLYVHEMAMPADEYREAMAGTDFGDALRARMAAVGVGPEGAQALLDRAAADPGWRGLGALDAAVRGLEAAPSIPDGGAGERLPALFACAFEKRCEGADKVPPALWSVRPAPKGRDGEAQVQVRGALLLAISGRRAPEAP